MQSTEGEVDGKKLLVSLEQSLKGINELQKVSLSLALPRQKILLARVADQFFPSAELRLFEIGVQHILISQSIQGRLGPFDNM